MQSSIFKQTSQSKSQKPFGLHGKDVIKKVAPMRKHLIDEFKQDIVHGKITKNSLPNFKMNWERGTI